MNVLIIFFVKYLLAPIIVVIAIFVMSGMSKAKDALNVKHLVVFVLVTSIVLALPSVFGLLKYEFIWIGLILTVIFYLLVGLFFNSFSSSKMFEKIGLEKNKILIISALLIPIVLGGWIYYLSFSFLSKLNYASVAMFNILWVLTPVFYVYSKNLFLDIPNPFYNSWTVVAESDEDYAYWDNVDTFRLMQVKVKIKRSVNSLQYSSFSVKLPQEVLLGLWFNRFIADQNIRFPNDAIEIENKDGTFGWIFYTSKWFNIPLFTRMLDFTTNVSLNDIKNNTTIYVRRVSQNKKETTAQDSIPTDT